MAIGFAFVDAAAGKFYVGTISDDCSRSALGSLLTQVNLSILNNSNNNLINIAHSQQSVDFKCHG